MKTIFFISCIIFAFYSKFAFAINENDVDELPHFDMDSELSPEELQELKELVARELKLHDLSKLQALKVDAILNQFIDEILENVRKMIVDDGLDSTSLPDFAVDIGIGDTKLTEGQLNDTSTVERSGNALLSYNSTTKKLKLQMTLKFLDLKFIYKYYTKVILLSMTGHLHGVIKDVHINIQIGFDFKTVLVSVDSIDFKNTGSIDLEVSGNALVDWITNAMSFVLTALLHDTILNIAENLIADPINAIVDYINKILHPSLISLT